MISDERKKEIDESLKKAIDLLNEKGILTLVIAIDQDDYRNSEKNMLRIVDNLIDEIGRDAVMELLLNALQRVGQESVTMMDLSDLDNSKDKYVS